MIKYYLKNYFIEIFLILSGIAGLVLGFVVHWGWFTMMGANVLYTATNIRTIRKLNRIIDNLRSVIGAHENYYNEYD